MKTKTQKQLFISRLLCFLFGHKKSVPMLIEDEETIYTHGCPRCGTPMGLPAAWKNITPPPNSNEEQVKTWNEFKEKLYDVIRASVSEKDTFS